MERDKLKQRLNKLLAMSRDTSSPAEAAIADRRMKALMDKYDVSFAELANTGLDYTQRKSPERPPKSSARRRSPRPSKRRKAERPTVQRNGSVRPVIIGACVIAVALSSWFVFTNVDETRLGTASVPARQIVEGSQYKAASLNTLVERSSIIEGESIVLHVTGTAVSSVPSTATLLQDFSIIKTQVNRDANAQGFQMRVELQPRQAGMLFIPSLYVDGISSKVIVIDVVARNLSLR